MATEENNQNASAEIIQIMSAEGFWVLYMCSVDTEVHRISAVYGDRLAGFALIERVDNEGSYRSIEGFSTRSGTPELVTEDESYLSITSKEAAREDGVQATEDEAIDAVHQVFEDLCHGELEDKDLPHFGQLLKRRIGQVEVTVTPLYHKAS